MNRKIIKIHFIPICFQFIHNDFKLLECFTFAAQLTRMNFLAHAHLSGENNDILFGNFIADAVKGKQMARYKEGIRTGIRLHREIDTFTDRHALVKHSVSRVKADYGRYSGVVVDIYYDHFLASGWERYHKDELGVFAARVYGLLTRHFFILPDRTKRMLPFLIAQNWLTAYADFSGLKNVFKGMDRRTGLLSGMGDAVAGLERNYDGLKQDFEAFYPELFQFSEQTLQRLLRENGKG